jgi:hypothetical protein
MLFQKSIISFVAAIALATSVSASAFAARDGAPVCPAGLTPYCCNSSLQPNNLPTDTLGSLKNGFSGLNTNEPVGEGCSATQGSWYCVFSTLFVSHEMAHAP